MGCMNQAGFKHIGRNWRESESTPSDTRENGTSQDQSETTDVIMSFPHGGNVSSTEFQLY